MRAKHPSGTSPALAQGGRNLNVNVINVNLNILRSPFFGVAIGIGIAFEWFECSIFLDPDADSDPDENTEWNTS